MQQINKMVEVFRIVGVVGVVWGQTPKKRRRNNYLASY